jgi:hypothetical protein
MKIAYIPNIFKGRIGDSQHPMLRRYVRRLVERGHDVTVYYPAYGQAIHDGVGAGTPVILPELTGTPDDAIVHHYVRALGRNGGINQTLVITQQAWSAFWL